MVLCNHIALLKLLSPQHSSSGTRVYITETHSFNPHGVSYYWLLLCSLTGLLSTRLDPALVHIHIGKNKFNTSPGSLSCYRLQLRSLANFDRKTSKQTLTHYPFIWLNLCSLNNMLTR